MSDQSEFEVAMKRLAEANKRITELEERVDELEASTADGRKARLENILEHASKLQRNGEDVALNYKEIAAAAGCGVTTAYKDMEYFPDHHDFVRKHKTPSGETRLVFDGSHFTGEKHDHE